MKKVLIVIDMLNDFCDVNGKLFCGEGAREIIPFIKEKIKTYRENGDFIIFLHDYHRPDDREFERFNEHCVMGTWGSEFIPELRPLPHDVTISKQRYSGFYGTGLDAILKTLRVEDVEVVGVCTSICVMDTVGGLANRDYNITVPVKGVADFDYDGHLFSLKRMKHIYGARLED